MRTSTVVLILLASIVSLFFVARSREFSSSSSATTSSSTSPSPTSAPSIDSKPQQQQQQQAIHSHDVPLRHLSSLTARLDWNFAADAMRCSEQLSLGKRWGHDVVTHAQLFRSAGASGGITNASLKRFHQEQQQRRRRRWRQTQNNNNREIRCTAIPNWDSPLLPFEVSRDEMTCSPDSFFERRWRALRNRTAVVNAQRQLQQQGQSTSFSSSIGWFNHAFSDSAAADGGIAPHQVIGSLFFQQVELAASEEHASESTLNTLAAGNGDNNDAVPFHLTVDWRMRYSRFVFHTSFLFHGYLPWRPLPVMTNTTIAEPGHFVPNTYRAFHDAASENIYRIHNFCITPYGGISGYYPAGVHNFAGLEDSRHYYHQMYGLSTILNYFERRTEPVLFLDQRPVIFFPSIAQSRWNLAHTLHQFLALLGIYRNEFVTGWPSRNSSSLSSTSPSLSPLVIIVYDMHWAKSLEVNKTAALAFFFRTLDLPYAAVVTPKITDKDRKLLPTIFALTDHHTNGDDVRSGFDGGAEICFARALVYQNCFNCEQVVPEKEHESYSFGDWVRPNKFRVAILNDFRDRVERCLPLKGPAAKLFLPLLVSSNINASKNTSGTIAKQVVEHQLPLPRVYFDLRSGATRTPFSKLRSIRDINIFMEFVESSLVDVDNAGDDDDNGASISSNDNGFSYLEELSWREPWRGSRARQVNYLRSSQIFVGVHGGSFSQVSMMQRGSVVIELTVPHFAVHKNRPDSWFGIYTRALDHDHFFFQLLNTSVFGQHPQNSNSNNGPDLRWSSRGIGLKDKFSVSPVFLVDVLKVASCRWLRRMAATTTSATATTSRRRWVMTAKQIEMCSERVLGSVCKRVTATRTSSMIDEAEDLAAQQLEEQQFQQAEQQKLQHKSNHRPASCTGQRMMHFLHDDRIYAGYTVQAIFHSFFHAGDDKITLGEATAIAERVLDALQRALNQLGEVLRGTPQYQSREGAHSVPFLEFDAHTTLRLQCSGASRFASMWQRIVNHLGGWDGDLIVHSLSSDTLQRETHREQLSAPDVCLFVGGARRTCLYVSVIENEAAKLNA